MASPQEMASYYKGYPDPNDATTWAPAQSFEEAKAQFEAVKGAPPTPSPVVPPAAPGGGKPAARLGDMTAHGGALMVGDPTTLIGNMPAARVADMHACPMVTGVVPHVGGPVNPPGSTTVLIGGMPAARMGDMLTCTGPPDVIAQGEFTVMIG